MITLAGIPVESSPEASKDRILVHPEVLLHIEHVLGMMSVTPAGYVILSPAAEA